MFFMSREKSQMVPRDQALPGRGTPIATATTHFVTGRPLQAAARGGVAGGDVWHGLLLGSGADVLGHRRGLGDHGGLCGRLYAKSDL